MVDCIIEHMDNHSLGLKTRSDHGNTYNNNNNNKAYPPSRQHSFQRGGGLNGSSHHQYHHGGRNSPRRHMSRNLSNMSNHSHHGNTKSFRKSPLAPSNSFYDPLGGGSNHSTRSTGSFQHSYKKPIMPAKSQYVAMDCEMVACGVESVAARVVLVDWKGRKILDEYMKPKETVTDYRTFVSGIKEEHLQDAPEFEVVQQQVKDMLADKILVGHGVDNDLRALKITHPWLSTRDTAYYQPFMRLIETSTRNNPNISQTPVWGPRKLKDLAKEKLQRDIQVAGVSHCPVEDAAAALDLYKSHRPRWEACMSTEEKRQHLQKLQEAAAAQAAAYEQQQYYYSSGGLDGYSNHGTPLQPLDATVSLHTGYSQHASYTNPTPGLHRYNSFGNDTTRGLDAHSFHGGGGGGGYQPHHPRPRAIQRLASFQEDYSQEQMPKPRALYRRSSFDSNFHPSNAVY